MRVGPAPEARHAWKGTRQPQQANHQRHAQQDLQARGQREPGCGAAPRRAAHRTGSAYSRPPLFQRLLAPRGSCSTDLGPTLRSKISP